MADFTLDTSGFVTLRRADAPWKGRPRPDIYWEDLAPFTQGYVEALFHSAFGGDLQADGSWKMRVGFSDLAPETLAAILKDCASQGDNHAIAERGAAFWRARQEGRYPLAFPPLTVTLGGEGRVYLREASHG